VAPTGGFNFTAVAGAPTTAIAGTLGAPASLTTNQPQPMLGEQANIHFAMVADATGNVFIAGDVGVQASGWAGNIYVFTPAGAGAAANAWTQLVDQTGVVGTVRPHADSPRSSSRPHRRGRLSHRSLRRALERKRRRCLQAESW